MTKVIPPQVVLSLILFAFTLSRPSLCLALEPPGHAEAVAFDRANTELWKVYQQLKSQLPPQQQITLRQEQRAWIKWRDQEAVRLASRGGGVRGSAYRVNYSKVQLKLLLRRTEVLRRRLKTS